MCFYLGTLFNQCLMHGKNLQQCIKTNPVHICKNYNGNINDVGNYRPVCIATIISKVFEHYILSCMSPFIATTDNQFGFKPEHSTGLCVSLLKLNISFYMQTTAPLSSRLF